VYATVATAERLLRRPLPFAGGGARHKVGLRPVDPGAWLELTGDDAAGQLAEKRRVFDGHRGAVLAALPGSQEACLELLDLVREATAGGPAVSVPAGCHPLEEAGRMVPEDFCVHLPDSETGVLTLVAGCVAFPNRWTLADKLGQPVTAVHTPVPDYAAQLGRPVERVMDRLPDSRILERHNWGVVGDGELFAPLPAAARRADWQGIGLQQWLRVERQTLRRLPQSGAVVFTIRTLMAPLEILRGDPEAAGLLGEAIRELPHDVARYKLGPPIARAALLEWLAGL
jgi:dimethylamine monooxygenase subunit A